MVGLQRRSALRSLHPLHESDTEKYENQVRFRFYDTEFFSARVTDVWKWEAKSRHAYELVVEELRETPLWDRFFSIVEILAGVENAYARNYDREAVSA